MNNKEICSLLVRMVFLVGTAILIFTSIVLYNQDDIDRATYFLVVAFIHYYISDKNK